MNKSLKRTVGLYGALILGLGSMVGTGVYVVVPMVASQLGMGVLICIILAALLAVCNGLNSAQLAVNYPVSGGTYEYGYKLLSPALGFVAGWTFLLAKSASAATALLALVVYALGEQIQLPLKIALSLMVLFAMLKLVLSGIRRTNRVNAVLVAIAILGLLLFTLITLFLKEPAISEPLIPSENILAIGWVEACALIFVAYTGYGRIATLGEEIRDPRKNITRAMWLTLGVTALIYMVVGWAAAGNAAYFGHGDLRSMLLAAEGPSFLAAVVGIGAGVAMLGVVLNLLLGLSRMLLAMARRDDMPTVFAELDKNQDPRAAIWGVGGIIGILVLIGDVKTAWTFSAFTVLIYYGICNLAAIQLKDEQRIYPKWVGYLGLLGCVFLAVNLDLTTVLIGAVLIVIGLGWQLYRLMRRKKIS